MGNLQREVGILFDQQDGDAVPLVDLHDLFENRFDEEYRPSPSPHCFRAAVSNEGGDLPVFHDQRGASPMDLIVGLHG